MILIDAGPLVALNDLRDSASADCAEALAQLPNQPLLTTWPYVAEAMYLLGQSGGFEKQQALWRNWHDDTIEFIDLTREESKLMAELMRRYQDLPMDLADASLVAVADLRGWRKVLTLDSHFYAYRLHDGSALEVILPTKEMP